MNLRRLRRCSSRDGIFGCRMDRQWLLWRLILSAEKLLQVDDKVVVRPVSEIVEGVLYEGTD